MKNYFLIGTVLIIILSSSNIANAQRFKDLLPHDLSLINSSGEDLRGVNGSQYLCNDWAFGSIILIDGNSIDSIKLRLNAYKDEMHYIDLGKEYVIGAPDRIKCIFMNSRKFIYGVYVNKGIVSNNYFEVLVNGETELLVRYYITKMPPTYNQALDTGEKNERLKLNERYYIRYKTNIIELDKKGKELVKIMGENKNNLMKQIDQENLSFKKKEDLIKIVSYINLKK